MPHDNDGFPDVLAAVHLSKSSPRFLQPLVTLLATSNLARCHKRHDFGVKSTQGLLGTIPEAIKESIDCDDLLEYETEILKANARLVLSVGVEKRDTYLYCTSVVVISCADRSACLCQWKVSNELNMTRIAYDDSTKHVHVL